MAVTLRYFTEFGKLALQKTTCDGIYARVYLFWVRVQCHRKESSRSLSHLLMSFLFSYLMPTAKNTPKILLKVNARLEFSKPSPNISNIQHNTTCSSSSDKFLSCALNEKGERFLICYDRKQLLLRWPHNVTRKGKCRDFTCKSKADKISLVYHTNQTKKRWKEQNKNRWTIKSGNGHKNQ